MNSFYNLLLGEFWGKKMVPKLKKKNELKIFHFLSVLDAEINPHTVPKFINTEAYVSGPEG